MANETSESTNRPYVVLEEIELVRLVTELLRQADVPLSEEQRERTERAIGGREVYLVTERIPSRNAAHALTQVGRKYDIGVTPPLVAVSERMFRPRQVTVDAGDPRISLA